MCSRDLQKDFLVSAFKKCTHIIEKCVYLKNGKFDIFKIWRDIYDFGFQDREKPFWRFLTNVVSCMQAKNGVSVTISNGVMDAVRSEKWKMRKSHLNSLECSG